MKIKNILKVAAVSSVMVFSSCNKNFLELTPTDQVTTDNFYQTYNEHYGSLLGVYEVLSKDYPSWQYAPMNMLSDLMSDDAYAGGGSIGDQSDWQDMGRFRLNSANALTSAIWSKNYSGIQRANTLIWNFNDDAFKQSDAEQADKNNFKGEAMALRAHYYFELARHYGNIILIEENPDLANIGQSTPAEVYAYIAKDFMEAIPLMKDAVPQDGRLGKYAAMAELAKVFLFYTGYYNTDTLPVLDGSALSKADILSMLNSVITDSKSMLSADYAALFNPSLGEGDYNPEVIFEIPHKDTAYPGWGPDKLGNMGTQMAGPRGYSSSTNFLVGGWGFGIPSQELVAAYEPGDLRKDATVISAQKLIDDRNDVDPPAEGVGLDINFNHTGYYTFKYTTHPSFVPLVQPAMNFPQNYHYIRLADVYLMAAELSIGTNQAKADEYVNIVRTRAGLSSKAGVSLEDIQHERRVELALEGHRYFDVLRRGVSQAKIELDELNYQLKKGAGDNEVYMNGDNDLRGDIGNPQDFEVTFDAGKAGFWPIPQSELDQMTNLSQNPGY